MSLRISDRADRGKRKASRRFPLSACRLPPDQGFTLIEIILAVTILGLILTTVYGVLSRTMFSKEVAEERGELYSNGRQALLRMANEIEASLHPDSGFYFRGDGGGGSGTPEVVFVTTNRGGYGINRVRPGSVLVAYSLDPLPRPRGAFALRRDEYLWSKLVAKSQGIEETETDLELDEEGQDAADAPTEQATYLLDCPDHPGELNLPGTCTPTTGLQFRFYDEVADEFRDEWNSDEDPTYHRLPAAVEIVLRVADRNGVEQEFATIVDLPVARGQPTQVANPLGAAAGGATDPGGAGGAPGTGRGRDDLDDEEAD